MNNYNNNSQIITQNNIVSLKYKLKKWVILENHLKIINEKTKKIREMKDNLTTEICEIFMENNMDYVNTNEGKIKMYEKKEYTNLTFSYVRETLCDVFIKNEESITNNNDENEEHEEIIELIENIMVALQNNRKIKFSADLKIIKN
jgi:hypothetical protein